jgi:chromosome segregation ATPase
MRDRLQGEAPQAAPANASPDQRVALLRAEAKFLKSRETVAKEAWDELMEQGREMERRSLQLRLELGRRDERISELEAEIERAGVQLRGVQTEFETFQGEITRIFQEKDAEERETLARLAELEELNGNQAKEIDEHKKRIEDDQQRLRIFQEEVDTLQADLEKAAEVDVALKAAERQITDLKARLQTTEGVAGERAEEIESVRERLDRVAIEAANERRHLEARHEEALREKDEQLAEVRAELEAQNAELASELDDALTQLQQIRNDLGRTTAQRDALAKVKEELGAALADSDSAARAREQELTHKLLELEQEHSGAAAVIDELGNLREELETQLFRERERADRAEAEASAHAAEIERLVQENGEIVAQRDALERELDDAREALSAENEAKGKRATLHEEQLREAEEELEELRTSLFDRLAELDQIKSGQQGAEKRSRELEIALRASEERLRVSELRGQQVEAQLSAEREEVEALSQRLMEAEAAKDAAEASEREALDSLDQEHTKNERNESFIKRAKEKIVELQRRHEEATAAARKEWEAQVERERKARQELEDHLTEVESELTRRELEAAEATRQTLELERELEVMREKLQTNIEAREQRIAGQGQELDQLRAAQREAQQKLTVEQDRVRILTDDLRGRDNQELALRQEIEEREGMISKLQDDLRASEQALREMSNVAREQERRAELMARLVRRLEEAQSLLKANAQAAGAKAQIGELTEPPGAPLPPPPRRVELAAAGEPRKVEGGKKEPPLPPPPPIDPKKRKKGKKEEKLDEAAKLLASAPRTGGSPERAPDPFRVTSGLPTPAGDGEETLAVESEREESQVTEIIRLEDLK